MRKFSEIIATYKKRKEFRYGESVRRTLFHGSFNFVRCGMESKEVFDQSIKEYYQFVDKHSDVLLPLEVGYYKNRAAKEFNSLNSKLVSILSSTPIQTS